MGDDGDPGTVPAQGGETARNGMYCLCRFLQIRVSRFPFRPTAFPGAAPEGGDPRPMATGRIVGEDAAARTGRIRNGEAPAGEIDIHSRFAVGSTAVPDGTGKKRWNGCRTVFHRRMRRKILFFPANDLIFYEICCILIGFV